MTTLSSAAQTTLPLEHSLSGGLRPAHLQPNLRSWGPRKPLLLGDRGPRGLPPKPSPPSCLLDLPESLTGAESKNQPYLSPDGALSWQTVTDLPPLPKQGAPASPSSPPPRRPASILPASPGDTRCGFHRASGTPGLNTPACSLSSVSCPRGRRDGSCGHGWGLAPFPGRREEGALSVARAGAGPGEGEFAGGDARQGGGSGGQQLSGKEPFCWEHESQPLVKERPSQARARGCRVLCLGLLLRRG